MNMSFDTLRVYEAGRFYDVALPDWYEEADRLSRSGNASWHHAFTRVLGCYPVPLTDEGCEGGWIEVRFWPSAQVGIFVLIATEAGIIEQVLIPASIDWLPFLTAHITPLISAVAQTASAERQRKLTRAFIAWARHGKGIRQLQLDPRGAPLLSDGHQRRNGRFRPPLQFNRQEQRLRQDRKQPLLLQLMPPGVNLLPRHIMPLRNLGHRCATHPD
jgi:hypothetical protein